MSGKLMRKVVLTVKEEATYAVDASPTSLANSILARVSDAQPVMAEFADRDNIMPYLGSSGKVLVSTHSEIDVEFELAGASAAGTSPGWAALLKAMGFSQTIVAATSVTFNPVSSGFKSVSKYYYLDGLLHKMLGSMGSGVLNLSARTIPSVAAKYKGLYSAPTDTSLPTDSDYSAFLAPQAINKINTTAFTLHGVTVPFDTLSIDLGVETVYTNMPQLEEISIRDRKVSGNISIPMTTVAVKAWAEAIRVGTLDALSMTHGSIAGGIFTIGGPKVRITDHKYSDKDGRLMLNLGLDFRPSSGNDELSIAIT